MPNAWGSSWSLLGWGSAWGSPEAVVTLDDIAEQLAREAVGAALLIDLDTTEGHVRLFLGEDGIFTDNNGVSWLGAKFLSLGDVEAPRAGQAPAFELTASYTYDPNATDLVSVARSYGVSAVDGRDAVLYLQYFGSLEEMFAPIWKPIRITTRTMRKLTYAFDGPESRRLTLTCEGPWPLRGKPVNGRYTDADQRRRQDGDPSLEFMPTNGWDDQQLFAL